MFFLKLSKKSYEFKNILVINIEPQIAVKKMFGILRVKSHGSKPCDIIMKNTQFSLFQKYFFPKIEQKSYEFINIVVINIEPQENLQFTI